jgi:phosphotransferase system HPr-like phosphotransfer protein
MTDRKTDAERGKVAAPSTPWALADDGPDPATLDRVLRASDYRERLSRDAEELFRLEATWRASDLPEPSRRFCLRLTEVAERLEYALLDVGARGNRTYAFFAEAVSAARWLAKAVHALLHLRARIRRYLGERADLGPFRAELDAWILRLSGRTTGVLAGVRREALELGLSLPTTPYGPEDLVVADARWRLPQDLDVAESVGERERIAETATAFLAIVDELAPLSVPEAAPLAAVAAFAQGTLGDARAHELRVRMHGIQSTYDAVVAATPLEAADPSLKVFRGYVSIVLHLLESAAYVLRLHSRLSDDARGARVFERIAPLVDRDELLVFAIPFAVGNARRCLVEARDVAVKLLARYSKVSEIELELPPGRKLHLRPAGLIVRVVQHHGLAVEMGMGAETVDARQLMDVILLAAGHPDATKVRFRGDERPLADLARLFHHKLGEEGFDTLPPELSYVREPSRGTSTP